LQQDANDAARTGHHLSCSRECRFGASAASSHTHARAVSAPRRRIGLASIPSLLRRL